MFEPYTLHARELLNREGLVIRFTDPDYFKVYPNVQVVQGVLTYSDAVLNPGHKYVHKYDHTSVSFGPYESYTLPDEHLVEVVGEVAYTAISYINNPNRFQPTED